MQIVVLHLFCWYTYNPLLTRNYFQMSCMFVVFEIYNKKCSVAMHVNCRWRCWHCHN